MREWVLTESNHSLVRSQHWEVAVLPFGATEPHNLHMPYGTDNFEVEEVGNRAVSGLTTASQCPFAATIPYGVQLLKPPSSMRAWTAIRSQTVSSRDSDEVYSSAAVAVGHVAATS